MTVVGGNKYHIFINFQHKFLDYTDTVLDYYQYCQFEHICLDSSKAMHTMLDKLTKYG